MSTTKYVPKPLPVGGGICALTALLILLPTLRTAAARLTSPALQQTQASQSMPWSDLGAKATAQYSGEGLAVFADEHGKVRLRCAFQQLEGEVTREGLWLASTTDGAAAARFRVVADCVGRDSGAMVALPERGVAGLEAGRARYARRGLVEGYSVSVDGVRQDFVVADPPGGAGALRLELALSGARAEAAPHGAGLVLAGSGRKLAYSRLRVVDAGERELAARIEVVADDRLAVVVADTAAIYPVRIDPTFSDANWVSLGGKPGVDGWVYTVVVDGTGNLYAGGSFAEASGVTVNHIAKWNGNGSGWSALGSGMDSVVYALAVSGTDLYAGGGFTEAGGVSANGIAKWNGSAWSALGSGMDSVVYALGVSGTDLYAGGFFTTAGGVTVNHITKWDGSAWSALGSGMDDYVYGLTVSGRDLYAGGLFSTAGGVTVNRIAKWNGSAWSALGSGMDDYVYALAVSGTDLYAGGYFTTAGGVSAYGVAKWDGSAWSALDSRINNRVFALAVSGTDLYVAGDFISKWNGSAWSALGQGMNGTVLALAVSGMDLYAGGVFIEAGGFERTVNRIAKWNGNAWSALRSGLDRPVSALAVSGTDLYAGGAFITAAGVTVNGLAKWDGSAWSALGSGIDGGVSALAVSGTDLYAGGDFSTVGGVTVNGIAKWDGSAWSALGRGMNGTVLALAVSGTDLYASGSFTEAGGVSANGIAKWDGSAWSALGSGIWDEGIFNLNTDAVDALAVSGTDLYACGYFVTAGGATVNCIAKWDGSAWSALGWGSDDSVHALAVSGTDLYACGHFTTAGGVSANNIAKWNGSAWSALGSGMNDDVLALAVFGTDLYAGGYFSTAGEVSANCIAKWNGSAWSALGSGISGVEGPIGRPFVWALAVYGTDLYAGGDFTTAGGKISAYAAKASLANLVANVIVGRWIFYNQSSFDGNDPAANAADDLAIASDKRALLPGQTATFANYTSYRRGINGIMVDIAGLSGTPTTDDFSFKVGNDNAPAAWSTPQEGQTSITVRPGAGVDGSARLTITWNDGNIKKQWLQVTIKATANTGLALDDVFYFGNAPGECGNDPSNAMVNIIDVAATRANPRSPVDPAPIDCEYDYDRDGLVNVTDIAIARANQTSPITCLQLITAPP